MMDYATVSLGVTLGVAIISYLVSHFYLWTMGRLSQQDIIIISFLLWSSAMSVLMGGSYVFLGGATGEIPLLSDLWIDYSALDSRFAEQQTWLMAVQAMSFFILAPGSAFLAYSIVTADKLRALVQPTLAAAMLLGSLMLLTTELIDGLEHTDMNPIGLMLLTLSNAPYLVFPGILLKQSYMVTTGKESYGAARGASLRRPSKKGR